MTGVTGNARWEFDIQFTDTTTRQLMGYGGASSEYWGVQTSGRYGLHTQWTHMQTQAGGRDIVVHNFGENGEYYIEVKGERGWVGSEDVLNKEYSIFSLVSSDGSPAAPCYAKLYAGNVVQNGQIIRNFVPCINPSGEIGLYDFVTKRFYGNAGTGEFLITLPSEYKKLEYIESTGTQYIDTGYSTSEGFSVNSTIMFTGEEVVGNYIIGSHYQYSPYGRNGIGLNGYNKWEVGTGDYYATASFGPSLDVKYNVSGSTLKGNSYVEVDGVIVASNADTTSRCNYNLWIFQNQYSLAIDIPVEGTFDADRAKVFGNRPKQLLVYRAKYGEDAMNKTIHFAKAGIPVIGIDSVPSLVPKEDAEKVLKSADRDSIEEQRIGGTARLLNKYLPTIEEIIEVTGTSVIFINQVRDKMNAMMFGEKTDTPGGRKLKHSCSLRIQVARRAWIEIPNKNPYNSAATEKVGFIMKCKVVKSKVCNPMGECEIPCFFDRGFVSFDDVKTIRKELMRQRAEEFGKRVTKDLLEDDDE